MKDLDITIPDSWLKFECFQCKHTVEYDPSQYTPETFYYNIIDHDKKEIVVKDGHLCGECLMKSNN